MPRRRVAGPRPTRRSMLQAGFTAAVAALASSGGPAEAGDEGSFQPYDKVAPEAYPWGWIRWLLNGQIDKNAEMTLGLVHMEPNQVNARHVHPNSAEVLHVISGRLEHLVGQRWHSLKAGDTLRIPKGAPHQARTAGEGFLALIAYDTPRRVMVPAPEPKTP
jgi:quercetin dioxygenase-like cupin family protein